MIITEIYNENFVRTYSDEGKKIERDGRVFCEAIDPLGSNREYTETDIPVQVLDDDGGE